MNLADQAYFDSNYSDYERQTSSRKLAFYMALLCTWVERGSPVFELGVGMGHFIQRATEYFECSGCDINRAGLAAAYERAPRAMLYEGSFETISAESPCSAVLSWDVLEHIHDLDDALSTIRTNLEQNGFLIGVVPVYDGPLGWLVERLDRDPTHVWKLSRRAWLSKLEQHGFRIVQWGGVIRRLILGRFYLHMCWPQCMLRHVGSAIYFVCQKVG